MNECEEGRSISNTRINRMECHPAAYILFVDSSSNHMESGPAIYIYLVVSSSAGPPSTATHCYSKKLLLLLRLMRFLFLSPHNLILVSLQHSRSFSSDRNFLSHLMFAMKQKHRDKYSTVTRDYKLYAETDHGSRQQFNRGLSVSHCRPPKYNAFCDNGETMNENN